MVQSFQDRNPFFPFQHFCDQISRDANEILGGPFRMIEESIAANIEKLRDLAAAENQLSVTTLRNGA